jgi:hypothetical protein
VQPTSSRAGSPENPEPRPPEGWLENWDEEELAALQLADPSVSMVLGWMP